MSEIESYPDAIPTRQNTEQDPDLDLKMELKKMFPVVDGLMLQTALDNHRRWVKTYGEDYEPEHVLELENKNIS